MSFSKFPKFQKFTICDAPAYLAHYASLDAPYCDFSINDLFIWANYNQDLELSELNKNIVLRFSNILDNNRIYYTILGINRPNSTLNSLKHLFESLPPTPQLSYITEAFATVCQKLGRTDLTIKLDENNHDYIYNVNDLLRLEGKTYENLRRRINTFTRHNPSIELREFNLNQEHDQRIIEKTIVKWSDKVGTSKNDPEKREISVIKAHLKLAKHLPVHAYGLYTDKQLVNINIFHLPPHEGWLIFNHIKCDYDYEGVYGYAFYNLFLLAQSKNIKWINFEQDLGIEGLRQIKHLFRPAKFLHRYTVSFDFDKNQ